MKTHNEIDILFLSVADDGDGGDDSENEEESELSVDGVTILSSVPSSRALLAMDFREFHCGSSFSMP